MVVYVLGRSDGVYKKIKELRGSLRPVWVGSASGISPGESGVVIARNISPEKAKIPSGYIGICEEADTDALNLFKRSGIAAITCGFSSTASVTLSSSAEESASVGILRPMLALNGRRIEEGEITLKLNSGYDVFAVMAWASAGLLCYGDKFFDHSFDNRPAF